MDLYGSLVANEGSGGGGGGTVDVHIKSISVNGSGVAPVNKNVNIDVPTKTSDLTNDSNFASTSDIPTKTSELENDSNFASTTDIPTKVSELDNDSKFVTENELTAKGYASTSDIPTKVSQLTNDSKFVTESDLTAKDYADKTYVGEQISQSEHLKREIVTVLPEPTVADEHTIYMLKDESIKGSDKYKEYMLIEGVVQCVGDTSVDLTDYAKTADVDASISTLQKSKADLSVLKEHTDNVDIHVTAKEKTTWGTVTNKVDKEEGKGLSSNDYTSKEKTKLGNIGTSQGRNIIPYPYTSKDGISNGITWTVNDDGTVTANGTATNHSFFNLTNYVVGKWGTLHSGTYTITDSVNLPVGGVTVQIESTTGTQYKNKTFTIEQDVVYKIFIYIPKGFVADNITFKPMFEVGAIAHSYEPTTESNVSLKSAVDKKADKSETTVNILKPTLQTTTMDGVTCTNNGDGTYTFNGTATKEVIFIFLSDKQRKLFYKNTVGKTLKFLNGGVVHYPVGRFIFTLRDGDNWWSKGEKNDNDVFTVSEGYSEVVIDLHIYKDQTVKNLTVNPMITTNLSATNDDFVPYTGDRGSLNESVAELNDTKVDKSEVCVNLLNPTLQKETTSGVTCTNNGDGTYTLNGTATGYKAFVLTELHSNIGRFAGCKIVGLPDGTDTNNIDLSVSYRYENGDASHGNNLGDIVDNAKNTDKSVKVLLIVRNAQTISNMIVKPMLTTNLNATYDDFVPYTGEGKTLSHNVAEIKKDLGDLTFSASGTTLTITDGTNTWTLEANK